MDFKKCPKCNSTIKYSFLAPFEGIIRMKKYCKCGYSDFIKHYKSKQNITTMDKKDKIKQLADDIRNGKGIDRSVFPDDRKGNIAQKLWDDSTFTYGLEYGVLYAEYILEKEN